MTDKLLNLISNEFTLNPRDVRDFKALKANGMKFQIRSFDVPDLGLVSVMEAKGFFGLMKMDTLIINPLVKDAPLFSYDRVHAMGNDTLIFELYNTFLTPQRLNSLDRVKVDAAGLPDHDLGEHWYDSIKLPQSLSKKGRSNISKDFDEIVLAYTEEFLQICKAAPACDRKPKQEKASQYVEGLLTHGGPSTDVFKKAIGEEKTAELFRTVLFGTWD